MQVHPSDPPSTVSIMLIVTERKDIIRYVVEESVGREPAEPKIGECTGPAAAPGGAARDPVGEPGLAVGEQVPGDDKDGAAHCDDDAFGAAAPGDASVPLAKESVSLRGARGRVPEYSRRAGIPVAVEPLLPADTAPASRSGWVAVEAMAAPSLVMIW